MGVPQLDFILEEVILQGLQEIYSNLDKRVADIFGDFNSIPLLATHGKKHLDLIKDYLFRDKIRVIQGWSLVGQSCPCYSINLASQNEDVPRTFLSDYADQIDVQTPSSDILTNITPTSYDPVTGYLFFNDGVDLASVFPGDFFFDVAGNQFLIQAGIINIIGNKKINIGINQTVNIAGQTKITTPPGLVRNITSAIPFRSKLTIGVHTEKDPNTCKYMYAILYYILIKYKLQLESYGLQISVSNATDLSKMNQYLPDNVYTRTVTLDSLVYISIVTESINQMTNIDSFRLVVRVQRDQWALLDPNYTLNTTVDKEQPPLMF